jgi:hypothetical protein
VKSLLEFARKQLIKQIQEKNGEHGVSVQNMGGLVQDAMQETKEAIMLEVEEPVNKIAVDMVSPWVLAKAPELVQTLVVRYNDAAGAVGEEVLREAAVLNHLEGNSIVLMPKDKVKVDPEHPLDKIGKKLELTSQKGGGRRKVNVYAGTMEAPFQNGTAKVGVLAVDGELTPEDTVLVMRWLRNQPENNKKRLKKMLQLKGKNIENEILEIPADSSVIAAWQENMTEDIMAALPNTTYIVFRIKGGFSLAVEGSPKKRRALDMIGSLIDGDKYAALDTEERVKDLVINVYQPGNLRGQAGVSAQRSEMGEALGVSMIRGMDSRFDTGIGEVPDLPAYFKNILKPSGRASMLLFPFMRPEKDIATEGEAVSMFESIDLRAGDEALIGLDEVSEINDLILQGTLKHEDLFVPGDNEMVNRKEVFDHKLEMLNSARKELFSKSDSQRMREYRQFVSGNHSWLPGYAQKMAAWYPLKGATRKEVKETFQYMQWLLMYQFAMALQTIHLQGGKAQFWLELDAANFDEGLDALSRWFSLGFDGVFIRLKDETAADDAHLERLKKAIEKAKPLLLDEFNIDASVMVRLPAERNKTITAGELWEKYGFHKVRYYSELFNGTPVHEREVVLLDPPENDMRPHVKANVRTEEDMKTLYAAMLKNAGSAQYVFDTIGDPFFDDMPVSTEGYRLPLSSRERALLTPGEAIQFVAGQVQVLEQAARKRSYKTGYLKGLEMGKKIALDEKEQTILGTVLYDINKEYQKIRNDTEMPGEKARARDDSFSQALPVLQKLALSEGANAKYWRAILSEVQQLQLRDDEGSMQYPVALAGVLRGVAEGMLETSWRTDGFRMPNYESDKALVRQLLFTAAASGLDVREIAREKKDALSVSSAAGKLNDADSFAGVLDRAIGKMRVNSNKSSTELAAEIMPEINPLIAEIINNGTVPESDKAVAQRAMGQLMHVLEMIKDPDPSIYNNENLKKALREQAPGLINRILSAA